MIIHANARQLRNLMSMLDSLKDSLGAPTFVRREAIKFMLGVCLRKMVRRSAIHSTFTPFTYLVNVYSDPLGFEIQPSQHLFDFFSDALV